MPARVERIAVGALSLPTEAGFRKAGVGRHSLGLLGALAALDDRPELDVFLPAAFELPPAWAAAPRVRWHPIPLRGSRDRLVWEHLRLGGRARRLGADVLLSLMPALPVGAAPPLATFVHDAFPRTHPEGFPPRKRRILDAYLSHAARRCRLVLAVSEFSKREYARAYRFPVERIRVVPNGPGNDLRRPTPEEAAAADLGALGVPPGRYVFTLSTLEPRKNLPRLLGAFARLAQDPAFADLSLVVAGARGWMDSPVFDRVRELNLRERVAFLGYVPDEALPAIFARCEAFALPSVAEGFGIPVLEAMLMGAPVVTSEGSSLREVAGDAAWYADPLDEGSIAAALREALTDVPGRAYRIKEGLERGQAFTWESAARLTAHALRELPSYPR